MIERILIVGLGSIGGRHLRLARERFPKADIRVLRHRESASTPEYANGCFSNMQQALEFAPQLAVIANPTSFHVQSSLPLAEAGVHLLVEKPLSSSPEGVEKLLQTCHERQGILLLGYNLRFLPSLQRFRELLREQVIGKVISVRCEVGQFLPSWRPDADYRQGVSARREFGGGVLLELSHELDYLRWIFGEVDRVTASLSRQSGLDIDVEDTAHLILEFAPAADGYRLIGDASLDFVRRDTTRVCTAIGEKGSLRWNGVTGIVEKFDVDANAWCELFHHMPQRDDSYLTEWEHLLECIEGSQTPLIGGDDGLAVLNIVDAARKSSESGRAIRVARVGA